MSNHKIDFASRQFSSPRTSGKRSLDARLDRVFQMAENVDARCFYLIDAAAQKRRPALSAL